MHFPILYHVHKFFIVLLTTYSYFMAGFMSIKYADRETLDSNKKCNQYNFYI